MQHSITSPWMAEANMVPGMVHRRNTVFASGQHEFPLLPWAQRAAQAPGSAEQQAAFPYIGDNPMSPLFHMEGQQVVDTVQADASAGSLQFGRLSGSLGRTIRVGSGGIASGAMLGARPGARTIRRRRGMYRPTRSWRWGFRGLGAAGDGMNTPADVVAIDPRPWYQKPLYVGSAIAALGVGYFMLKK